jgi:hypothetical protein
LDSDRLLGRRQELQQVLLASSVTSRRLLTQSEHLLRDVGHELFNALFSSPGVSGRLRASSAVAQERGEPLRIVLRLNAPELAALPWEAMYDTEAGAYVCRREPLVRYVPVTSAAAPLRVRLPLRVLALVSSPRGLPALDVEKERQNLDRALAEPIRTGAVDLQWAEDATWGALQDLLLSDEWHILHFIGHGDFDVEQDEGELALVGADGRVNRVEASRFVDLLREAQPMPRLVVLNSCASATSGAHDLFSATAAILVRGGVSAVAAMQFEITDAAAIEFCRGFYTAIARGRGIDEAARSGRVAILGTGSRTLEWITPVLYLRSLDAHLFAVEASDGGDASSGRADQGTLHRAGGSAADAGQPLLTGPSVRISESGSEVASDTDRAAVQRSESGPRQVVERDPLERLWERARELSWTTRPYKADLKVLAAVISPDERVIGVCRLPFSLYSSCVFVVTNQNVYLGGVNDLGRTWSRIFEQTPEQFRFNPSVLRFPRADVSSCTITDSTFVLRVAGGTEITFEVYGSSSYQPLVARFFDAAQ